MNENEPEVVESDEQPVSAVIVVRNKDEQGNISTDIVLQNVEPDMVQTLLEIGLAGWRAKIGLDR